MNSGLSLLRRPAAGWAAGAVLLAAPGAAAAPRTVLAELFGAMDCADCAEARAALATVQAEGAAVTWLEYHAGAPLGNAGADTRAAYYGVTARPTLRIDGTGGQTGGGDITAEYRAGIQAAEALDAPLTVSALFFFEVESGLGSVVVDLTVDPGQTIADPAGVVIRTLVVEDSVAACCGPGGTAAWPRVVRSVLPERTLTAAAPGERQTFETTFALDPAWNPDRLGGAVLVQREADRSVLAAAEGAVSGELAPLPTLVFDANRPYLFPAFPNPTPDRVRVDFFLPRADDATLRIVDVGGRVVRVITDGPRTRGLHPLTWDGTDPRGRRMASGVYVATLETSTVILSRRLTLLR